MIPFSLISCVRRSALALAARCRGPGLRLVWRCGIQDLEYAPGRGGAFHAGVKLRADRSQRQESLRGEQQHQQRCFVAQVAVQQPEPNLDRNKRGSYRRG